MTMLSRVVGGALAGLGKGLSDDAENRRKEALLILEHQYRNEESDKAALAKRAEADRQREFEGGQISGIFTDNQGNVIPYTRRGGAGASLGKAKPDKAAAADPTKYWDEKTGTVRYGTPEEVLGRAAEDPARKETRVGLRDTLAEAVRKGYQLTERDKAALAILRPENDNAVETVRKKVMAGNVESLTPGERTVYEDSKKAQDFLSTLLGGVATGAIPGGSRGGLSPFVDDGLGPQASAPQSQSSPSVAIAPLTTGGVPVPRIGTTSGASIHPPPEALAKLKEGVPTTFNNGQVWMLQNGKPVKVK